MLLNLSIRNFVIVDQAELSFDTGFTVLTGETGAGKSILIDALELASGGRANSDLIRYGCERAEITASFDVRSNTEIHAWLQENALEGDPDTCLLRRVIEKNGRSRSYINGYSATLQQLRTASGWLLDIHSQHAHQSLLSSQKQRELLDTWANCQTLVREVASTYRYWQDLHQQKLEQEQYIQQNLQEYEALAQQELELTALNFSVEEWEQLQTDHNRLAHATGLLENTQFSLDTLSDNEIAVLTQLNAVLSRMHAQLDTDPTLSPLYDQLQSAQIQLQDTVYELKRYQQNLDIDPRKLQETEERIAAIHATARKYRTQPELLSELLVTTQQHLQILRKKVDSQALSEAEAVAEKEYSKLADKLSRIRHEAANKLSIAVTALMQTLAMAGGRLHIALQSIQPGSYGTEQTEFQVSSHAELPLRPLSKVASGGELSRISLAIQVVTSQSNSSSVLVFDEVDTGIGGRVAEKIGGMLQQLGKTRQVISITHLPQVAAMGDHHWQISKTTSIQKDQLPVSSVNHLQESERIEEIARMLGGTKLTAATRQHATEMLRNSRPH